jgi:hypothetical protein
MDQLAPAPFLSDWSQGEASSWQNPIDYLLVERLIAFLEGAAVFRPPEDGRAALLGSTFLGECPWLLNQLPSVDDHWNDAVDGLADITQLGYGVELEGGRTIIVQHASGVESVTFEQAPEKGSLILIDRTTARL